MGPEKIGKSGREPTHPLLLMFIQVRLVTSTRKEGGLEVSRLSSRPASLIGGGSAPFLPFHALPCSFHALHPTKWWMNICFTGHKAKPSVGMRPGFGASKRRHLQEVLALATPPTGRFGAFPSLLNLFSCYENALTEMPSPLVFCKPEST